VWPFKTFRSCKHCVNSALAAFAFLRNGRNLGHNFSVATLLAADRISEREEYRSDLIAFAEYLRRRWRFAAITVATATGLALAFTFAQAKRYTATASILIEAPAGNDPRAATAVSAIYLESLKTYEHFAESNTLFAQALQKLDLRANGRQSLESLKKRVLRVSKLRDTKILQISTTLEDPQKAEALARYIAQQTVELNRSLDRNSEREVTEQASRTLAEATDRLRRADQARDAFAGANPIESLEEEERAGNDLQARLNRELTESREDLAQYLAQSPAGAADDQDQMKRQIAGLKARIASAEKETEELKKALAAKSGLLEERKHRREVLDNERQAARAQYELAATKKNDILASGVFRGERLAIIDPGTVPERPSSPNIPLNVAVAVLFSLFASFVYLTIAFGYSRLRDERAL
jgi:uncharacterized protein involved in exopolysaccharide biosynthesis